MNNNIKAVLLTISASFFAVLMEALIKAAQYDSNVYTIGFLRFFFGFIISFYHFGIENNFFQESFICNLTGDSKITNSSELLKSLKTGPISCKDVPFKLLGMSLASINTVLTLFICVISLRILVNYEN